MNNLLPYHYLVVDISSGDENENLQSTPIKTLPLSMIEALNLSAELTRAALGSERDRDIFGTTFESESSPRKFDVGIFPERTVPSQDKEAFTVEGHLAEEPKTRYHEETDSSQQLPPLLPISFLRDITNHSPE